MTTAIEFIEEALVLCDGWEDGNPPSDKSISELLGKIDTVHRGLKRTDMESRSAIDQYVTPGVLNRLASLKIRVRCIAPLEESGWQENERQGEA